MNIHNKYSYKQATTTCERTRPRVKFRVTHILKKLKAMSIQCWLILNWLAILKQKVMIIFKNNTKLDFKNFKKHLLDEFLSLVKSHFTRFATGKTGYAEKKSFHIKYKVKINFPITNPINVLGWPRSRLTNWPKHKYICCSSKFKKMKINWRSYHIYSKNQNLNRKQT